ncbi:hypothetical protein GGX14DRAFT_578924 [Mycena pura]|uniref:Uncharacterized protein n=1 Tax=Mycena pura TaxID=153505 RepID=A0AAD6UNP3_9AGAR|nr:hypothetical protein GGX14DRAFT_578924 [Mycena pura]
MMTSTSAPSTPAKALCDTDAAAPKTTIGDGLGNGHIAVSGTRTRAATRVASRQNRTHTVRAACEGRESHEDPNVTRCTGTRNSGRQAVHAGAAERNMFSIISAATVRARDAAGEIDGNGAAEGVGIEDRMRNSTAGSAQPPPALPIAGAPPDLVLRPPAPIPGGTGPATRPAICAGSAAPSKQPHSYPTSHGHRYARTRRRAPACPPRHTSPHVPRPRLHQKREHRRLQALRGGVRAITHEPVEVDYAADSLVSVDMSSFNPSAMRQQLAAQRAVYAAIAATPNLELAPVQLKEFHNLSSSSRSSHSHLSNTRVTTSCELMKVERPSKKAGAAAQQADPQEEGRASLRAIAAGKRARARSRERARRRAGRRRRRQGSKTGPRTLTGACAERCEAAAGAAVENKTADAHGSVRGAGRGSGGGRGRKPARARSQERARGGAGQRRRQGSKTEPAHAHGSVRGAGRGSSGGVKQTRARARERARSGAKERQRRGQKRARARSRERVRGGSEGVAAVVKTRPRTLMGACAGQSEGAAAAGVKNQPAHAHRSVRGAVPRERCEAAADIFQSAHDSEQHAIASALVMDRKLTGRKKWQTNHATAPARIGGLPNTEAMC